jgi:hypothetical protein
VGKGGGGLAPFVLASVLDALALFVDASLLLSSDFAPEVFATLFGGGAKELTSLWSIFAKCLRSPTCNGSSFLSMGWG